MMFERKKVATLLDYSEDYFINELGISKWEYLKLYKDYLIIEIKVIHAGNLCHTTSILNRMIDRTSHWN